MASASLDVFKELSLNPADTSSHGVVGAQRAVCWEVAAEKRGE